MERLVIQLVKDILMLSIALVVMVYTVYFALLVIYEAMLDQNIEPSVVVIGLIGFLCKIPIDAEIFGLQDDLGWICVVTGYLNTVAWSVSISLLFVLSSRLLFFRNGAYK